MVVSGVAGPLRSVGYWSLAVALIVMLLPGQVHAQEDSFDDVPAGHVFAEEIAWLASTGITQGRGDGTFGVDGPVTRGAMAAFLFRFEGEPDGPFDAPDFSDVSEGSLFATEIGWLASTGITQGRGDGTFGVNDPVTRGAMAAFLFRFEGEPDGPFDAPDFSDVSEGSLFATEIGWLASTGITQGRGDGTFGVNDPVTRGAMAAFLYRFDLYRRGEPLPPPPAAPPETDGKTWTPVPHDDVFDGTGGQFGGDVRTGMHAVTAGGPGVVAVGHDNTHGQLVAAVWTSPDGRNWQRVPHDPDVFGNGDDLSKVMTDVVAGGPGLVAVGWDNAAGAAVWTSVDGRTWERITSDAFEWQSSMEAVTVGGPGLIAVGREYDSDRPEIEGLAAVWTSVDGRSWERAPDVDTELGDAYGQAMSAVTVGGPGLIAVGVEWRASFNTAAVWTSENGWNWQRVPRDTTLFGSRSAMESVRPAPGGGAGLLALGRDWTGGDTRAAMWTSTDGHDWQRVADPGAMFGGTPQARPIQIIDAGSKYVAIGNGNGVAAVWTSQDGNSWSRVPHDDAIFGGGDRLANFSSMAVAGPGLVAVGRVTFVDGDEFRLYGAVWTSP